MASERRNMFYENKKTEICHPFVILNVLPQECWCPSCDRFVKLTPFIRINPEHGVEGIRVEGARFIAVALKSLGPQLPTVQSNMNSLWSFVTLFALVSVAAGRTSVLDNLASLTRMRLREDPVTPVSPTTPASPTDVCRGNQGYGTKKCSGTDSWVFCIGEIPGEMKKCPEDKPRCSNGECGALPFDCPWEYGYFPSLTDCKSFQLCVGKTATRYDCPQGAVYDPEMKACGRQAAFRPCLEFNCTGRKWEAVRYPGDVRMFTICDGSSRPLGVFACDNDKVFVEKDMSCSQECLREGNMKTDNPSNFIECVIDAGGRFVKTPRTCPDKTSFDPVSRSCVLNKS
ncbi:hypothetical protein AAG570_006150 [Ranatra chinensis]|uniref:Chitin-binding type-2 domain-containing protein n=1 Tax=Ranatra chinensis TaxID=642074 RepID=A0ABD0XX76_9HEMI